MPRINKPQLNDNERSSTLSNPPTQPQEESATVELSEFTTEETELKFSNDEERFNWLAVHMVSIREQMDEDNTGSLSILNELQQFVKHLMNDYKSDEGEANRGRVRRHLDQLIDSLRDNDAIRLVAMFHKVTYTRALDGAEKCPICVEKLKSDDVVIVLPCDHKYHQQCCTDLFHIEDKCSVCRQFYSPLLLQQYHQGQHLHQRDWEQAAQEENEEEEEEAQLHHLAPRATASTSTKK